MDGSDGYVALKEPRLRDGSSVILRLRNFATQIEANQIGALDMEVSAMVRLESKHCEDPGRITDISKTSGGMLVLSNCKKSEKIGQIWWVADNAAQPQMTLLTSLRNGRPEGMAFGADQKTVYLTSDNGERKGSDFLKVDLPPVH